MSADLKVEVHRRLLADDVAVDAGRAAVRARLVEHLRDVAPVLPGAEADALLDELVVEVCGLGPLEPLLADPSVTEVMVNGPGRAFVERGGTVRPVALDLDAAGITRLAERIIAPLGLRLDRSSPLVDARLADGSRLHAVLPPVAPDGPCLTIRRFGRAALGLEAFGLDPGAIARVEAMVRAGWNLLVAGATGAGKTTLANALATAIDPGERVVTVEETAELRFGLPHVVRLEARPANAEGVGAVGVRDLVRAALRMRPDRLVVGEVRGAEAFDLLQALNTGHDGSCSTIHANGPAEALSRLETLVLLAGTGLPVAAIRAQVVTALDAVVAVRRGRDGARLVEQVAEVGNGVGPGRPVPVRMLLRRDGDRLVAVDRPGRPARRPGAVDPARAWDPC